MWAEFSAYLFLGPRDPDDLLLLSDLIFFKLSQDSRQRSVISVPKPPPPPQLPLSATLVKGGVGGGFASNCHCCTPLYHSEASVGTRPANGAPLKQLEPPLKQLEACISEEDVQLAALKASHCARVVFRVMRPTACPWPAEHSLTSVPEERGTLLLGEGAGVPPGCSASPPRARARVRTRSAPEECWERRGYRGNWASPLSPGGYRADDAR